MDNKIHRCLYTTSLCSSYRTVVLYHHQNIHSRTCLLKFGSFILIWVTFWKAFLQLKEWLKDIRCPNIHDATGAFGKGYLKKTKTTGVFGNDVLRNQQAYHGEKVIENLTCQGKKLTTHKADGGELKQSNTLQGTNISHLGKRKIIFKSAFLGGDMLVPRGWPLLIETHKPAKCPTLWRLATW